MHPDAAAFLHEIRTAPKVAAALAAGDLVWVEHVEAIEHGFRVMYAKGADNPQAIEMLDQVHSVINQREPGLKARLLKLLILLAKQRPVWGFE